MGKSHFPRKSIKTSKFFCFPELYRKVKSSSLSELRVQWYEWLEVVYCFSHRLGFKERFLFINSFIYTGVSIHVFQVQNKKRKTGTFHLPFAPIIMKDEAQINQLQTISLSTWIPSFNNCTSCNWSSAIAAAEITVLVPCCALSPGLPVSLNQRKLEWLRCFGTLFTTPNHRLCLCGVCWLASSTSFSFFPLYSVWPRMIRNRGLMVGMQAQNIATLTSTVFHTASGRKAPFEC